MESRILPDGSLTVADDELNYSLLALNHTKGIVRCVVCVSRPSNVRAPAGGVVGRRGPCLF
jgi:hypothetical protein